MATVSGTVKDKDGDFAARIVRAYRRSDGLVAGETTSHATTGALRTGEAWALNNLFNLAATL